MSVSIPLKQGASFILGLQFSNDDGTPTDLGTCSVTSQLRDSQNTLIANLPVVSGGVSGTASINVLDTSAWPLGVLRCDIKVASSQQIIFSETFSISVARSVTQ
jgi:hypothetical protein